MLLKLAYPLNEVRMLVNISCRFIHYHRSEKIELLVLSLLPIQPQVAVKIIDKKKARADKYVSLNMRREAKLMTMLCHSNILRLLDEVETANSYYLVTEMAEGGDLMDHIYKNTHLPEDEVRVYIRQIVSAIDHIHKAGIIHR